MHTGQAGKERCDLPRQWDAVNLKFENGRVLFNPLLASIAHLFQQKPDFSFR